MSIRSVPDKLEKLLLNIRNADPKLEVQRLDAVAEVFTGASYQAGDLSERPPRLGPEYGLLRVSDVAEGRLSSPSAWLKERAWKKMPGKYYVRSGDVLVSVAGTIGKTGVSGGQVYGIFASQGLAIIRPNDCVWSGFLAALLQSESYQAWLKDHARGKTIQHLSIKALRLLEVPVPSLPMQARIVTISKRDQRDPLFVLLAQLRNEEDDAIAIWLETVETRLKVENFESRGFFGARHVWMERVAQEIHELQQRIESGVTKSSNDELILLLGHMANATESLRNVVDHSLEGVGQMVMLQEARFQLNKALFWLSVSEKACFEQANSLYEKLLEEVEAEIRDLHDGTWFACELYPSWIAAGEESEVKLEVTNFGALDVRHIRLKTEPDLGSAEQAYLKAYDQIEMAISAPKDLPLGKFKFTVHIEGQTLFGEAISEDETLSLEVKWPQVAFEERDFGTSPYIVGGPVDRRDMFFGRQGIIERIRRQLSTDHRANVILLEGNRRTGKTSILQHLREYGVLPGWVVVNCSFQGAEGHEKEPGIPTREVFRHIAKSIGFELDRVELHPWFPDLEPHNPVRPFQTQFVRALRKAFDNEAPFETFEMYLQEALKLIRPHRLLLMLDEFDKLQEGIDAGITSPQVPENIRCLLHTYTDISAILTGSRRLKRLREEYWSALFGFGYRIPVEPLELGEAQKLVEHPVKGRLVYTSDARDRIVDLCDRQPFLIQSLCNRIFERAAETGERRVSRKMVEQASEEMIEDNEHFSTLWDYAGTGRKRLILALCNQLHESGRLVTLDVLQEQLRSEPYVPIPKGERLGDDLAELLELELLKRKTLKFTTYHLAVPLMRRWIRRHTDILDIRNRAIREAEEKL